jgi:hypothetical protein
MSGARALLVTVALAGCVSACHAEVALGAWDSDALAGAGGGNPPPDAGAGGAAGAGEGADLPACLASAAPGPSSAPGLFVGATETASDWAWPAPVPSLKWDLMVERDIERASPTSPPTSGYYFAHQFSFLEGVVGFLGLQAEGGYQQDPPLSPVEFTKIAVFWLSGPPLAGELGDIAYPDARVAPATVAGVSYLTVHARFDWQPCRVYRLRVGPHASEADGSTWYGASIEDTSTGVATFLGRMLLPSDIGLFAPFSSSRTLPIEFGDGASCETQARASAIFGVPSADDDSVDAVLAANRFVDPLRCTSSRFTAFPRAIRHELGLRP